jgi:hypothetical protein
VTSTCHLGNRRGVAGLGYIQSYENLCMLLHGSFFCAERLKKNAIAPGNL